MTVEQKLSLKAQGFKEDVKTHDVSVINAVDNKLDAYKIGRYDGYVAGYHEGNKANEWHYVKDGDLPKGKGAVLIYWKSGDLKCASVVEPYKVTEDTHIIAWKEIVLP